jgi:hypothetical protein
MTGFTIIDETVAMGGSEDIRLTHAPQSRCFPDSKSYAFAPAPFCFEGAC